MPELIKGASMWVVLPVGWQYNDEYYWRDNFEKPTGCFTIREMAEEFAQNKEIERFKSVAMDEYFGGFFSYEEDIPEEICRRYGIDAEGIFLTQKQISSLNDEEIIEIMDSFELKFYEVVETKIYC